MPATTRTIVLLASTACPLAAGTIVLDANYQPALTHTAAITSPPPAGYSFEDHAQTFVIENTGTLRSIEVRVGRGGFATPGPLAVDLRTTTESGAPSDNGPGVVLASGEIPSASILNTFPNYEWLSITGLNVPVVAGQRLAIVLENNGGGYYGWGCRINGEYAPGGMYRRAVGDSLPTGDLWEFTNGFDTAFRVFVEVAAACPGDANGDNQVNFNDLNILLGIFNSTGAGLAADFDSDGDVDFADLNTLLGVFNGTCS